jgi:hypothetical protein
MSSLDQPKGKYQVNSLRKKDYMLTLDGRKTHAAFELKKQ